MFRKDYLDKPFFRASNIYRLVGIVMLAISAVVASPEIDILGLRGPALALVGAILVSAPTLTEIFGRTKKAMRNPNDNFPGGAV